MSTERESYDTDINDAEWAFVAPYLTLLPEDAKQRRHDPREVLNAPPFRTATAAAVLRSPTPPTRWRETAG